MDLLKYRFDIICKILLYNWNIRSHAVITCMLRECMFSIMCIILHFEATERGIGDANVFTYVT